MLVIKRICHPEIVPLELSDIWVDGATLWEWSQEQVFPFVLRQALQSLQAGQGIYPDKTPIPAVISGFEAAFLTGGRVADQVLRGRLSGLPFAVLFPDNPVCAGALGGMAWLRARAESGWVVDLGSSQLKLAVPGRQWIFPRDWTRLPIAGQVSSAQLPAQRRRLREFIAFCLASALVEAGQPPQALVFALPARLAEDGTPANSSYAGMHNDSGLLSDAAELAGLPPVPLYVLNDAELAALGALADTRMGGFHKVLALTLGYGIGAALIHRAC